MWLPERPRDATRPRFSRCVWKFNVATATSMTSCLRRQTSRVITDVVYIRWPEVELHPEKWTNILWCARLRISQTTMEGANKQTMFGKTFWSQKRACVKSRSGLHRPGWQATRLFCDWSPGNTRFWNLLSLESRSRSGQVWRYAPRRSTNLFHWTKVCTLDLREDRRRKNLDLDPWPLSGQSRDQIHRL